MAEPFATKGTDNKNPGYVIITVRGKDYSIPTGYEQQVADEVAYNLDNA